MGSGWVKNDKNGYFHTSHLTPNPVFPEKEVSLLTQLRKPKDKLTSLHQMALLHFRSPLLLLTIHEEMWLKANCSPNPKPKGGTKVQ